MYNKLFAKIVTSSIWLEDAPTRIVWLTLLAVMDQDGFSQFSALGNLANTARVTLEEARFAIDKFEAPDPESGDKDHDGRRLERVPGGWLVLNAAKHRDLATAQMKRDQTRQRVHAHRQRSRNALVTQGNEKLTPSEALSEAEAIDLNQDQKQPPLNTASASPTRPAERDNNPGALYLIARDVLSEFGPSTMTTDLEEEIKCRAVHARLLYSGDLVAKALQSAKFIAEKLVQC
jgi:hypothetical protein